MGSLKAVRRQVDLIRSRWVDVQLDATATARTSHIPNQDICVVFQTQRSEFLILEKRRLLSMTFPNVSTWCPTKRNSYPVKPLRLPEFVPTNTWLKLLEKMHST